MTSILANALTADGRAWYTWHSDGRVTAQTVTPLADELGVQGGMCKLGLPFTVRERIHWTDAKFAVCWITESAENREQVA